MSGIPSRDLYSSPCLACLPARLDTSRSNRQLKDSAHIAKECIRISHEANDEHCHEDPQLGGMIFFTKQNKKQQVNLQFRKNNNNPADRDWRVDKSLHFSEMM